jgi:hypothetical protein
MSTLDLWVAGILLGYVAWALSLGRKRQPLPRPADQHGIVHRRIPFAGFAWTGVGVGFLAVLALGALRYRGDSAPADALVKKAERIECVERMRSMVAEASDAESSAVMSVDAKEAQESVDRSHVAIQETAKAEEALGKSLGDDGRSKKALSEFEASFSEFERVGRELGSLAPKNTNEEARQLAFGPAAEAVDRMDGAAARIVANNARSRDAARLALGAVVAARRSQALLPLHIAEASDAGMDRIESRMDEAEREARRDLDDLQGLPGLATDGDVSALATAFESFRGVRARILALSRENTNVRSLEIAAGKLRAAKIRCQDALDELQRSIHDAPVPGVRAAPPFNPRRLRSESPGDGVHS